MNRNALLFGLFFFVLTNCSFAQSESDVSSIKALIRDLNSPLPARREQAQQQLTEMGPAIVRPLFEEVERQTAPAEIRRRIARIKADWEAQAGIDFLHASQWGQTEQIKERVLKAGSLKAALQAIADQTENPFDLSRLDDDLPIPPDFANRFSDASGEFWPTVDYLAAQSQLNYVWFQRPKAVRFQKSEQLRQTNSQICYNGPFRLELSELAVSKRFSVVGANTIRFALVLAWEPRLKPIYFVFLDEKQNRQSAEVSEAPKPHASRNQTILFDAGSGVEILAGTAMAKPVEFTFVLPDSPDKANANAKRIEIPETEQSGAQGSAENQQNEAKQKTVTLSGRFAVIIAGKPELFVLKSATGANLLEKQPDLFPLAVRKDQALVHLKSVQKTNPKTVSAQLSIEFDESHNALRSYMNWINDNQATLVLANGERVASNNWETVWQSERGAQIRYFFPVSDGQAIESVEYRAPSAIRQQEYPFEFKNISLVF